MPACTLGFLSDCVTKGWPGLSDDYEWAVLHNGVSLLPEANFRNWMGGFRNINAAADFASSGGIPMSYVTAGGKLTKVRMEHVWVEATIDYLPSRGAINKSADSWVPMDPSYKQLQILQGLDAVQLSGINPTQLANDFINSGTVNEAKGWATGFNPVILQTAQTQAQTNLQNYIATNLPNATVGDVIGGRKIIEQVAPVLPASLPNKVVVTGTKYAILPTALEQKITFAFGKDILGDLINPRTFPWAQLNNQQVTLSFKPATQADEDTLKALLPTGTIADLSQLPQSIPAYLIHVIPELKLNGQVIMSGSSMTLGTDLDFNFNPIFVSSGEQPFHYLVTAGSYLSVAVIAGSINNARITSARERLSNVAEALVSADATQASAITRDILLGNLFEAGSLSYYSQYLALANVAGVPQGGHHSLAAGLGSVGYEVGVDSFFGIPRAIKLGTISLNIPIVNVIGVDSDSARERVGYSEEVGYLSSQLEASTPELLFSSSTYPGQSISASKALALASASGQRVYSINSQNIVSALAQIHCSGSLKAEINDAVASGKEVTIHTDAVSISGWQGFGYVISDVLTGEGAYKISGGANGGAFDFLKNVNDSIKYSRLLFYITGWISSEALSELGPIGAFSGMLTGTAKILDNCLGIANSAQIAALIGIQLAMSIALTFLPGGFLFRYIFNSLIQVIINTVIVDSLEYLAGCRA